MVGGQVRLLAAGVPGEWGGSERLLDLEFL
jgi:hypothetical protein